MLIKIYYDDYKRMCWCCGHEAIPPNDLTTKQYLKALNRFEKWLKNKGE